jgi:hypothetical protein
VAAEPYRSDTENSLVATMSDARTEARRRLATALHAAECGCPDYVYGLEDEDERFDHLADAVLELFENVAWNVLLGSEYYGPLPAPLEAAIGRRLVFRGPVEPVVPRELQP